MMKLKNILTIIIFSSLVGFSISYAHIFDGEPSSAMQAYIYRDGLMHVISGQRTILRGMAGGDVAMDEEKFIKAANNLTTAFSIIPNAFEDHMSVDESLAKPVIWQNWDDFVAKADELRMKAQEISEVASRQGADAAKDLVGGIRCGGCHGEYKYDVEELF
jgi:cytochrome c556